MSFIDELITNDPEVSAYANEHAATGVLKLVRKRLAVEMKPDISPFVKLLARLLNTQDHEVRVLPRCLLFSF